jgi:hypothetical protein
MVRGYEVTRMQPVYPTAHQPGLPKLLREDRYELCIALLGRLDLLRRHLRLNYNEMARLLEVDHNSYRCWRRSSPERFTKPSDYTLVLLVQRVRGLTLNWLYLGEEDGLWSELRNGLNRAAHPSAR